MFKYTKPVVNNKCKKVGGLWHSYYLKVQSYDGNTLKKTDWYFVQDSHIGKVEAPTKTTPIEECDAYGFDEAEGSI